MTIRQYQAPSPRNCLQCDRRTVVMWVKAGIEPEVKCQPHPEFHEVRCDRNCFVEQGGESRPPGTH